MDFNSERSNLRALLDEGSGVQFVPANLVDDPLAGVLQETVVLEALLTGLISNVPANSRERRLVEEQFEVVERMLEGDLGTLELGRIRLYVTRLSTAYREYMQAFEA